MELALRQDGSGLLWHAPLAFIGACTVDLVLLTTPGRAAFGIWLRTRNIRSCWLTKPPGEQAFGALVEGDDGWWSIVNLTVRSEAPGQIGVELVDDICRYADRSNYTLAINASEPS